LAKQHVPHAGQQLDETTITVGKGYDNVGAVKTTCLDVDQGQNEGGEGEGRQTQGCRVGELAVRGPVETRLEFTAKRCKAKIRVVGSNMCKRVAAIVIRRPLLGHASAIGAWGMVGRAGSLFETCAALS